MLRQFGLCVPYIYNPLELEIMAGQFYAPRHPGAKKSRMNTRGGIYHMN